jgi:hypothetical protein
LARIEPVLTMIFFPDGRVTTPPVVSTSNVLPRSLAFRPTPLTGGSGLK